jgi:carboxymethylenebutenolidase
VCFELDSLPPVPRIAGAAVSHDDVELEAADGNRFAAFEATPDRPNGVGVVILPDVRGLYRFYEELALRFAERGYSALAIDYFGRTAGSAKRGDDFDYSPHVAQTTQEGIQADVRAAVEYLRPARGRSSASASASAGVTRGWPPPRGTASPERSASTGGPPSATEYRARPSARRS